MHLLKRHRLFRLNSEKSLLCNLLSGEVLVTSAAGHRALEALRAGDESEAPQGFLTELRERGFLFDSAADEDEAFVQACLPGWDEYLRTAPREYTFAVNAHCNFNCPYCFESESLRAKKLALTEAQVDAAFAVIDRDLAEGSFARRPNINLFGGEPLLPASKPLLEHLLGRLVERGFKATIQTNGYHLETFLDLLLAKQDALGTIQVTLDGPPGHHDQRRVLKGGGATFARIVQGLDAVAAAPASFSVQVRMNVDRENIDTLEEMARLYDERGWTRNRRFSFTAAPVNNRCGSVNPAKLLGHHEIFERTFGLSKDTRGGPFDVSNYKVLSHLRQTLGTAAASADDAASATEPKRFVPRVIHCASAALKYFLFHPDGRIYPCPELSGVTEHAIGTYAPTYEILAEKAAPWTNQATFVRDSCKACSISTLCGGGCLAGSLMHHGTPHRSFCEEASQVVDSYLVQLRLPEPAAALADAAASEASSTSAAH